jgi:hypothetical protein
LDHILQVLLVLRPLEVWAQAHKVWQVCELLRVLVWVLVVVVVSQQVVVQVVVQVVWEQAHMEVSQVLLVL